MNTRRRTAPVTWQGNSIATRLVLAFCRLVPHFRGKGRLFQWLVKYVFGGKLHVHNMAGVLLEIDPADYIGRTISFEGGFEPKSIALAQDIMLGGGVFLDIGCSFGLFTLSVGILPQVQCVAIDGSFVALAKLRENLDRNPRIDAKVVSCALDAHDRLQCFEVPIPQNLGSTRITNNEEDDNPSKFWVAALSLQEVLERLCPGDVKLLKIDVEGSELSVLKGLDFIGRYRPENLIVECYIKQFPNAKECFDFLLSNDYEAMTIDGNPIEDCITCPENNVWFRSLWKGKNDKR